MRALLIVTLTVLVGCAGPRAVVAPTVPVVLSHISVPHGVARGAAKPIDSSREDELLLDGGHFDPPLEPALAVYLRNELGPDAAARELVLSRVSVKIKSMASSSDTAGAVASVSYGAPPGSPPGAGLAGALIAAAIIEGVKSTSTASFVLVNIEGEFGGKPFAGFAYGVYSPADADCIEKVVLDAFAQAKASLAEKNETTKRETQ